MPGTPPGAAANAGQGVPGRRGSRGCGSQDSAANAGGQPAGRAQMRSKPDLHAAIRQQGRAALVVNTRSRRGLRLYRAARGQLEAVGLSLLGSFPVGRPGQLEVST